MKIIPLTQGQYTKVDDEDFEKLGKYKWHAHWAPTSRAFYALRTGPGGRKTSLSRVIMGIEDPGIKCDHINHDTLDNQKNNLRLCSTAENIRNRRGPQINSSSGFRGVSFDSGRGKWDARIKVNQKQICLGRFSKKEDAALAYKEANKKYFGEYGGGL